MARRRKWECTCEACTEHPRSAEATEHRKLNRAFAGLDEKHARRVLGLLAEQEGHGGIARLSRITGMSRTTILLGQRELVGQDPVPAERVRRPGGWSAVPGKKRPELTERLQEVRFGDELHIDTSVRMAQSVLRGTRSIA
jgi:hypothetical protein